MSKSAPLVSHEELRELLHYEPSTGVFTRLISRKCPNGKCGDRAGRVTTRGYRAVSINNRIYKEHRLAWFYVHHRWPSEFIDHINGDTSDNRICNLRECTRAQNMQNSRKPRNATSRLKGASFKTGMKRWRAQIGVSGKRIFLGYFNTEKEAHEAYLKAARKHFGDFVRAA